MSMNIKQIFEYEVHRKLSLRANTINSEINLLINAFKFYDINDTGKIGKEDFSKVFGRIGLNGISNKDLYSIFDIYDINKIGEIDYINFIEYMYDIAPFKPLNNDNSNLNTNDNIRRIPHQQIQQIKEQNVRLKTPYQTINDRNLNYVNPPVQNSFQQISTIQNEQNSSFKPVSPLKKDEPYKIQSNGVQNFNSQLQNNNVVNNNNNIQFQNYKQMNNNYYNNDNMNSNNNANINLNSSNNLNNYNMNNTINVLKPQSTNIKKYFQYLLQQIQNKINLNNGLIYYTFLSKLNEKQDRIYKTISLENFISCIQESNIQLDKSILQNFYYVLDFTEQNQVSTEEILRLIRGYLNERRKVKIIEKFTLLDINKKGYCEINLIKNSFKAKNHPQVLKRQKSENEIMSEFYFFFDTYIKYKEIYNQMSLDDFIEFYSGISSSIENDDYFIEIINNVWSLNNNNNQSLSNRDNFKYSNQLNNENSNPINRRSYSNFNFMRNKSEYNILTGDNYNNSNKNNNMNDRYSENRRHNNSLYYSYQSENIRNLKDNNPNPNFYPSIGPIDKLRSLLLSRGTKSIFILEKMFSMYDNNHSGKIDYNTLEKIIETYKLYLNKDELTQIFKNFDQENTGLINYDNLIKTIVGNMSLKRENLIKKVFNILSNGYNNDISIIEIKKKYNASRHPEVISSKKDINSIINDFSDNLDIFKDYIIPFSRSQTGFLNYNDFIKFYNQISLGISDDSHFEYLINNVWNLNGNIGRSYYN